MKSSRKASSQQKQSKTRSERPFRLLTFVIYLAKMLIQTRPLELRTQKAARAAVLSEIARLIKRETTSCFFDIMSSEGVYHGTVTEPTTAMPIIKHRIINDQYMYFVLLIVAKLYLIMFDWCSFYHVGCRACPKELVFLNSTRLFYKTLIFNDLLCNKNSRE